MDNFQKIEIGLIVVILLINLGFFIYVFDLGGISGFVLLKNEDLRVPFDFVSEDKIKADKDTVIIEIENPVLSRYFDSESMNPVLGKGATGVGVKPKSEADIHVGDIISFWQDSKILVHRVLEKGLDEQGVYFITKGDNNNFDDGKIRFSQIDSVLVAVIY